VNNNKIGKFISKLRKEKGLTQQELGNILFVTDKAVSKWERGLSLPDVTILNKLASTLDVSVSEILNGEKNKIKKFDIEKTIKEATLEIKNNQKKKMLKIVKIVLIISIVLIYILFRNIYLGYNIYKVDYNLLTENKRKINLGVPKLSILRKNHDRSYSFKNFRNREVLLGEIKEYLKTLEYLNCNDTIYYYNNEDDFSIIEYSVKDNILYSTITYQVVNHDYCYMEKLREYGKYINLRAFHSMNARYENKEDIKNKLTVIFIDGGNDVYKYEFKAKMEVSYYDNNGNEIILEKSVGEYEIKDEKLFYYRKEIEKESSNIKIPNVSVFLIEDKNLILDDNYLSAYEKEIILK